MITSPAWKDRKYAVLGLARSGRATVEALLAAGADVLVWDDNQETASALVERVRTKWADYAKVGARFELKNWMLATDLTDFDTIIVSPGVPLNTHPVSEKAARYDLPIIGDIELFAQARSDLPPHKVVGITGTNGKSTTTALVHHILKTAGVPTTMGGNIGLPILEQEPLPEGGVYVLELSSYQIDLTYSLDCDVAVLLNITPDHLDRYEDFHAYAASKGRLLRMQTKGRVGIFSADDKTADAVGSCILYEMQRYEDMAEACAASAFEGQKHWPSLQGPHNAQNADAARIACRAVGLDEVQIEKGLRSYPSLPHRMEQVAQISGVAYINDSKGTNTAASAPALAAFDNIHWILGGLAKEPGLGECEAELGHVKAAYTIGKAGPDFAALLEDRVPVEQCETLDRAVSSAASNAESGDTVLLSPACASFDQYRDFEARGEHFRELVEGLK